MVMKSMRNVYVCLQTCCFIVCLLLSGASYGDARSVYRQPVIMDTDIGNSTDDLYAMDLLYKMAQRGEVDIKGIVVDRQGDGFADLADILNTYYGFQIIVENTARLTEGENAFYRDVNGGHDFSVWNVNIFNALQMAFPKVTD
jgi:hypothetical protein